MKIGKDAESKMMTMLGPAAFYIGLLIVIIAMFITPSGWLYVVLGILGVIVGLLNITSKESGPFLFATIAFIVAALGMEYIDNCSRSDSAQGTYQTGSKHNGARRRGRCDHCTKGDLRSCKGQVILPLFLFFS